jgi:hypothetical protein
MSLFKANEIAPEVKINEITSPMLRYKKKIENRKKKESFNLLPIDLGLGKETIFKKKNVWAGLDTEKSMDKTDYLRQ